MKYFFVILILAAFAGCATQQEIQLKKLDTETEEDSVSYELIVLDPGFESWFITNSKPSWYYTQEYFEHWNQQYVNAWNYHHQGGRYSRILEGYIDYQPQVDYGLELNHKLFYYFQYVQHVLKIPLITGAPRIP